MARTKNHVVEERVTLPPFPAWARVEAAGWGPWSTKAGVHYAHAPAAALADVGHGFSSIV